MDWDRYLEVANMICFSVFDIVFDGSLGRKSYLGLAEISSVVCTWLNSRMGDAG